MNILGIGSLSGNALLPQAKTPVSPGGFQDLLMGGYAPSTDSASKSNPADDAIQQFNDYMKETPAQRWQDAWLTSHGISKQQFDAMSPAQQKAIMDEMKQEMEKKMKEDAAKSNTPTVDILA